MGISGRSENVQHRTIQVVTLIKLDRPRLEIVGNLDGRSIRRHIRRIQFNRLLHRFHAIVNDDADGYLPGERLGVQFQCNEVIGSGFHLRMEIFHLGIRFSRIQVHGQCSCRDKARAGLRLGESEGILDVLLVSENRCAVALVVGFQCITILDCDLGVRKTGCSGNVYTALAGIDGKWHKCLVVRRIETGCE